MDVLQQLNPAQRDAVEAIEGPVLVLAGPGSGKTRVLAHRVAYLVKVCGVEPWRILAVTFTNKAAREMRGRLDSLVGDELRRLTVGTFHANCARILRREADSLGLDRNFVIYDQDDQLRLVRNVMNELNLDDKVYRPTSIHAAISRAKNELIGPAEYHAASYWHEIAGRVYQRYQASLLANQALDFDDLLMRAVELFRRCPEVLSKYQQRYHFVLVDEFQDTNHAQYELLSVLGAKHRNLFCVGDEDQSIFAWRGADYRNILRFRQDFPEARVFLLEQNYRSTQVILDVAREVISRNRHRTDKKLWTENARGNPITVFEAYNEQEEAQYVIREIQRLVARGECNLRDCAIMYRTNAQSRVLEDAFVRTGLPYRIVGATRFYQRREIKDVMAYLRLAHNPMDTVSLLRVINVPTRGIGRRTLTAVETWAEQMNVPIYTALQMLQEAVTAQHEGREERTGLPILPLDTRGRNALLHFLSLLNDLIAARQNHALPALLNTVLERTGYERFIRDGTEEGEDRWANVMELHSVVQEYASLPSDQALTAFLEDASLVSDIDGLDEEVDAPILLTLHTAKGLEFRAVFIVGMEEGIFPHSRCFDDPDQMEEERRLCYVGITRVIDRLYLIYTFRRTLYGREELSEPSRFLRDIPPSLIAGQEVKPAPARLQHLARKVTSPQSVHTEPTFRTGDRVRHESFGEGVIVQSKVSAGDEELIVAFVGSGIRRLVASYARLEKVLE